MVLVMVLGLQYWPCAIGLGYAASLGRPACSEEPRQVCTGRALASLHRPAINHLEGLGLF